MAVYERSDDRADEAPYVTPRELSNKLDDAYQAIDEVRGQTVGIRERLVRVETYLKVLCGVIPLAVAFGPEIATALT